jgi:hypothetical protein
MSHINCMICNLRDLSIFEVLRQGMAMYGRCLPSILCPNQTQSLYVSLGLVVRSCLNLDTLQVDFVPQDAAAQSIIALKVALGRITAAVLAGSV